MMNSKLPLPTLGKIWDLADADKDGMLDKHEFTVVRSEYTIPIFLLKKYPTGYAFGLQSSGETRDSCYSASRFAKTYTTTHSHGTDGCTEQSNAML
jgi:Cytoskeletal-regulatory complex EF hand